MHSGLSGENGAFERVLAGSFEEPEVGLFAVGDQALVTRGSKVAGVVDKGGTVDTDGTLSNGLPKQKGSAIKAIIGESGRRAIAIAGVFTGSENPGKYHAYLRSRDAWARIDAGSRGWGEPTSAAWDANSLWLFVPDPFHLINGTLVQGEYPCSGFRRLKVEHVGLDGSVRSLPLVNAEFFPEQVVADEKGAAFVWGWSACRPGLLWGELRNTRVNLEVLPGSKACTTRTSNNGLPALEANAFPASGGGLYVLTYPNPAGAGSIDSACQTTTLYLRDARGAWSTSTLTAANEILSTGKAAPFVSPEGVVWAATNRSSVMAWTREGAAAEYPLAVSCAGGVELEHDGITESVALDPERPVDHFVASVRSQMWAVVRYGDRAQGLCRLERRTNKPYSLLK